MSKSKPVSEPIETKPPLMNGPAVAPELMDPNKFAASIPRLRAGIEARMNEIVQKEQQLAQAREQLAQARAQAQADAHDLGGQAKALAAILGKTVEQVLGIAAPAPEPEPKTVM